jgi:folate-binding protein YgfZ
MPMSELAVIPLDHLGVLSIRGPGTRDFLQGQLSQDMQRVTPQTPRLAGLHDPQGRCLALLRLFALDDAQWLAVLPRELLIPVTERLRRYVLRARVQIASATEQWRLHGVCGPQAVVAAVATPHPHLLPDGSRQRALVVAPRDTPLPQGPVLDEWQWHALDIRDGLPQVFAATTGLFTAQMLNLDLTDGVSFTKGCYTGQEIIARSHYLGQVKRRMQRFHTTAGTTLAPGASVRLQDGRRARIVSAAPTANDGQQFLAVTQSVGAESAPDTDTATMLQVTALPLPYSLPA